MELQHPERIEPASETLTPLGRDLHVQITNRALQDLRLDTHNPRLRTYTKGKVLDQQQLADALWDDPNTKALYSAIKASRGLTEALYVSPNGRVREGNRRLTCLLRIAANLAADAAARENGDDSHAPHFTDDERVALQRIVENVPCRILPADTTNAELDVLLARWHVAGKDEWSALDQAAHVHRLHHQDGLSVERIADLLGKSKPWVYQKLRAFEWTEEYLQESTERDLQDFSFFEELYKKKKAVQSAGLDIDTPTGMATFRRMVANRDIPTALDVRKLPSMLENPETRAMILSGDGEKALEALPLHDPGEFSPRFAALKNAKAQLGKLTREDQAMITRHRNYRQLLQDLRDELQHVLDSAGE